MRDPDADYNDGLVGLYEGVVVDNLDPLKIGRVRVMVPGLVEPASGWAMPIGGVGGGIDGQGFYRVPKVGSNVEVQFVGGNIDAPRFLVGPWGAPGGVPDSPAYVHPLSLADAVQVGVMQTDRWEIVLDDRPGQAMLRIRDLMFPTDVVEIDGVTHGVTISGTAAVVIKSIGVVSIEGLQILLNGRLVRPSGDPI